MNLLSQLVLTLALLLGCRFALAQISPTQHSAGISYISGGVGEEETIAILAEAKQWPLLLELSQIENGSTSTTSHMSSNSKKSRVLSLKNWCSAV